MYPCLAFPDPCRLVRQGSSARRGVRLLAGEHLHLPHEAAGVERLAARGAPLALELLHLPHEAAGVERPAASTSSGFVRLGVLSVIQLCWSWLILL
jgi:hypothetical protein